METSSMTKYFGLYCPQHGIWLKGGDGRIFYYSDEALMRAHWNQMQIEAEHFPATRLHLWEVTEIGQEQCVGPDRLQPLSALCTEPINRFKGMWEDAERCA